MENSYSLLSAKIKSGFVFVWLMVLSATVFAAQGKTFMAKDVFQTKVFLENKGLVEDYNGEAIKYFATINHLNAYFTAKGVLYKIHSVEAVKPGKDEEEQNDDNKKVIVKSALVNMNWIGANPNPEIIAEQKAPGYHTYLQKDGKGYKTLIAEGYKTITYKNIYPGIDAVYSFPEKGGMKYNLVVRPGADISKVKLAYAGDLKNMEVNADGDMFIRTEGGDLMEHAPVSYYDNGRQVESSFKLDGQLVQFNFPLPLNTSQKLIVDPWMQALTTLTDNNCGMNVDFDSVGNTYAYGAGPDNTLDASYYFEIAKYDPTGVLLWTFSGSVGSISWNSFSASNGNTNYPGNLYVDKSSQKVYVSKGHDGTATTVIRLNAAGAYDNFITATNPSFQEAWGLKYNCVDSTLLALGGGPSSNINMAIINTATGAIDTANYTHKTNGHQDIVCATFDNQGNLYTIMNGGSIPYTNTIYRVDPTLRNYTWSVNSTYTAMVEESNDPYWSSVASGNWNNCLAVNSSYLYYWDGLNISAYNLNTGAQIGPTAVLGYFFLLKEQGGIAVDNCNNVYVGGDDGKINTFSFNGSAFTAQADINFVSPYDQVNVQDIKYNSNNNLLYLTGGGQDGSGFAGTVVASLSAGCTQIGTSKTCNSGTVHVSPAAGTIFKYTWTNSSGVVVSQVSGSTDTTNTATNLSAGTYYIAVQGQANCNGSSLQDSVIITGGFTASMVTTTGTCTTNGTAKAIPTGAGTFTYLWSNGSTSQTITAPVGTYTVTITGTGGCQTTDTATITSSTNNITLVPSSTNAGCITNGTATVNVTTGTGPFTFSWNNSDTSQTISAAAGTYTVTVTGSGSCTVSTSATINPSANNIALVPSSTSAVCSSNGTATVSIGVGTGPFTFSWGNGDTTQTISAVAGTYTVTVTGAGSCTATTSATINQTGSNISLGTSSTNAGCISNGTATVTVSAGTGPFTYLWSSGDTTHVASGLASGTYTVTVTGTGGCTATGMATVNSSGGGITLVPGVTAATCGNPNGTAMVTVTAGSAPFHYSWSNGDTTATITGIGGGTYTVTVSGGGGCTTTSSATVNSTPAVTITTSSVNASCNSSNGNATATIVTGTAPYTFLWSNGGTNDSTSGVGAGVYTVTVTGFGGCTATGSATVTASTGIVLSAVAVSTTCGNNNGSVVANITSGTGPYTYLWNNLATTDTISGLASGTYSVTVTGTNHCTGTATAVVNPSGGNSVTITDSVHTICSSDSAHICAPPGFASYVWNHGQTTPCIYASQAGNYYVTVMDNAGCTATSNHLSLSVYPQPPVSISVNGDTLHVYNSVSQQWLLNGTAIPGATNPVYIASASGFYTVLVTDSNGCVTLSNKVQLAVGINDVVEDRVQVYPNPSAGSWQVEVSDNLLGAALDVFDDEGRLVYKSEIVGKHSEILFNAASGIYLLRISSSRQVLVKKLVKL